MKKNYVLDTNILIHNPNCLDKFSDNDIVSKYDDISVQPF